MPHSFRLLRRQDTGAVTVEWGVLTAAIVGLAVGAFAALETQSARIVGETAELMNEQLGKTPGVQATP